MVDGFVLKNKGNAYYLLPRLAAIALPNALNAEIMHLECLTNSKKYFVSSI